EDQDAEAACQYGRKAAQQAVSAAQAAKNQDDFIAHLRGILEMTARFFMNWKFRIAFAGSLLMVFALATFAQQKPVKYDSGTVSGLPARNIGSATMSGRVAAVTAVNENGRLTVFAGAASG